MTKKGKLSRYYRNEKEFKQIHSSLKQKNCPHCRVIGCLILFGYLYGYSETGSARVIRGHRIYCSNRNRRCGCGRTVSVFLAGVLKHWIIGAKTFWHALDNWRKGSAKLDSVKRAGYPCQQSTLYRFFRKLRINQPHIRSTLPPAHLSLTTNDPLLETISSLILAYPDADCPVIEFQYRTQKPFLPIPIRA